MTDKKRTIVVTTDRNFAADYAMLHNGELHIDTSGAEYHTITIEPRPTPPPPPPPLTWRDMVTDEMNLHHDSWDNVVGMTEFDFDTELAKNLESFTLWTRDRVYFQHYDGGYDSRIAIYSVPRNPCDERVSPY